MLSSLADMLADTDRCSRGEGNGTQLTMPLDELHVSHGGRNGGLNKSQRTPGPDNSIFTRESKSNDPASLLQNASSIQSMLRNTTETGSVVQLSSMQRRVPSPRSTRTPGISPRPRVASRNFSHPLSHPQQGPRPSNGRQTPKASRYGQ